MPTPSIPPELLRCIFAYLEPGHFKSDTVIGSLKNDLYACSLVSSTWRSIALSFICEDMRLRLEVAYLERQLRLMAPYHSPYSASAAHDYASHIRSLSFSFKHTCRKADIPRASSLALDLLQLISPNQLIKLVVTKYVRGCTCDISCTAACIATIASLIGNIESVQIRYWPANGYVQTLEPIYWRLPRSVRNISFQCCQMPRRADAIALPANGAHCHDFTRLPNVHTAIINCVDWPTPLLLGAVEVWSIQLRNISIRGPNSSNDEVITALARYCLELESLAISDGSVTDGAMLQLLDVCRKLRTLRCRNMVGLTEESLKKCAASKMHQWKVVQFVSCPGVKGKGVEDLSGFNQLETMWIMSLRESDSVDLEFAKRVSKIAKGMRVCILGDLFMKGRGEVRIDRISGTGDNHSSS